MESSTTTTTTSPQARKRNNTFHGAHEPFRHETELHVQKETVSGPVSFLDPTKAHVRHATHPDVRFQWSSRNNRKGRHALLVDQAQTSSKAQGTTPRPTSSPRSVARGIWRMLTYYPVWDVSFDVAYVFTLGSVIWVVNAFFAFLPLVQPSSGFRNEALYGGGITAFVGATVFEAGSVLLMAEAVNENRAGCSGWALARPPSRADVDDDDATAAVLAPSESNCTHHHPNRRNLVGKPRHPVSVPASASASASVSKAAPDTHPREWQWYPTSHDLRTHYLHSLGFLASLSQLCGASIFWIAGLTALPGIYDKMSRPVAIAFYWTPQVLGGLGFVVSGTLFMLETQSRWWKPAPRTLGWWIGAWNLVGGVGFTLCPAFGYDESSWAQYQAGLSTFWGSWAFLIGSVMQWYESLEKFPVEVDRRGTVGGGAKEGSRGNMHLDLA
ncbi:hypothetical protein PMIN06_006441 [Paraphaeosphaeria minitans]|uniref:Integral membrane protein n=1 Tax=Paraphaeosphaeria minitans TaxID=565426 RepID=A0A9P6GWS8_9PLEO|nr:hypothetical protein PMIN01_01504 [Paraphaeosphaeria minitans]